MKDKEKSAFENNSVMTEGRILNKLWTAANLETSFSGV